MKELIVSNKNTILSNSITFDERATQIKKQKIIEKQEEQLKKTSPFKNFVQYNRDYYMAEDWLLEKSPIAYRIFKFLIQNMDKYNAVICSYTVLEETFNVSKPTITRAIKVLKENQFVDIYKSGTSNVYCINKNIVWSSWGKNYQYAKFGANIILSKTENENFKKIKTQKINEVKIKKD